MGYTHYWKTKATDKVALESDSKPLTSTELVATESGDKLPSIYTDDEWNTIKELTQQILDVAVMNKIKIVNGSGEEGSIAEINDEYIWLNGEGEDSHETFSMDREAKDFDFCKTNQKPYDAIVTALLIMLENNFPDNIKCSSDGDAEDWQEGLKIAEQANRRIYRIPYGIDGAERLYDDDIFLLESNKDQMLLGSDEDNSPR